MVVTAFEWTLIGLIFVGVVLPIWAFFVAAFIAARRQRPTESSNRYFAYVRIIDRILDEVKTENKRGHIFAASVNELRSYPEFRHISVALLNDFNVTGNTQLDQILKAEITSTEAFLLEAKDD